MSVQPSQAVQHDSAHTLLNWAIALAIFGSAAALYLLDAPFFRADLRFLGPVVVIALAACCFWLMQAGRLTLAIDVMGFGICLSTGMIAMVNGGVHSPMIPIYPALILMYGWARHDRAGPIMAGAAVASILALWLLETRGFLPHEFNRPDSVYALITLIVCLLCGVSIVYIRKAYRSRINELNHISSELAGFTDLLEHSEARYRTLIEWMPEAILVHRNTQIVYANPAALRLFGAPDLATLKRKRTTDLICPDQLESQMQRMHQIVTGQEHPPMAQSCFLRLDGTPVPVEVQGTAIEFDGAPAIHVSIRDITERKRLEDEVRQLAFYDVLTGLPNRRLLDDRLSQALAASQRSNSYGALMFLDLDNFKPLNDQCGHAAGDQLLIAAAARLKSSVRAKDTVARYGGDEFVVLLPELGTNAQTAEQAALQAAQKILAVMAAPYSLHQVNNQQGHALAEHTCTISLGQVVYAPGHTNARLLVMQADAAMYEAKQAGRNQIVQSEATPATTTHDAT